MRFVLLGILALSVNACEQESALREPSPEERRGIVAEAIRAYEYESDLEPYRPVRLRAFDLLTSARELRLRPLHLRPTVAAVRVSRSDPRFATALVELRNARGRRMRGTTTVLVFRKGPDRELPWEPVAGTSTTLTRACTDATPEGVRHLVCPSPWSVFGYRQPRIRLNRTVAMRITSSDLRKVDWDAITLPGAACGATRPIHLRHGEALVRSATDPWWPAVFVSAGSAISYGDLDGDGQDEAAVGVVCSNLGGTAAGQLGFASVIFTARGRTMRAVGIVTARQPLDPTASHVPVVGRVEIRRGKMIAHEYWYGPNDGSCCASGRARTIWTHAAGSLRPTRTIVLRAPER